MAVRTTLARSLRSAPSIVTRPSTCPSAFQLSSPYIHAQKLRLQSFQYSSQSGGTGDTSPSNAETPPSADSSRNSTRDAASLTSQPRKSSQSDTADRFDAIFETLGLNKARFDKLAPMKKKETPLPTGPPAPRRSDLGHFSLSRPSSQSTEREIRDTYRSTIKRIELKLGPTLGRQVHVDPDKGVDLAAAIRNLQISCSVNRVRMQSNAQKFHVRRGQLKKDLKRERWRKLFKYSFIETVVKIQKMRAQGW